VVIQGYDHYSEDGHHYVFPPENIIHLKMPNPFTQYVGLGFTELIDMTLNMDMASLTYNWNFFRQGGSLENVLTSDKILTPSKRKEILDQFNERYMGY